MPNWRQGWADFRAGKLKKLGEPVACMAVYMMGAKCAAKMTDQKLFLVA